MKNTSISLMTLLRLVTDQYEPDERRQIELEVRANPDAFARMQKLRDVTINNSVHLHVASVNSMDRMDIDDSPQRIAAFIDETLNDEETVLFENDCWTSQELLHDVIILFQSNLQAQPEQIAGSECSDYSASERVLRHRLNDLMPATPPELQNQKSKIAAPLPTAIAQTKRIKELPTDVVDDNLIVVAQQKPASNQPTRLRMSSGKMLMISVAAMVSIVAISIGVVLLRSTQTPPTVDLEFPKKPKIQAKPIESIELPNSLGLADGDRGPGSTEGITESNHRDEPLPHSSQPMRNGAMPRNGMEDSLVETSDPKSIPTPGLVKNEPDKLNDVPENLSPPSLPWNWGRVEGLVAVRKPGSDVWSGALSENNPNEPVGSGGLECKVLPFSWAQAKIEGVGQWTITENTEFSLVATSVRQSENYEPESGSFYRDDASVKIDLHRGRIAISDANVGSTVLVKTTGGNWAIRITKESSVVVVEQGANSQVSVHSGSASINGSDLNARQQLTRARDGQVQQTVDHQPIRWLRKPEKTFPDKRFAKQWLETRDLFAELSKGDVVSAENQPLLRAAFATIDPPGQSVRYLANVMPDVRAEGIHWLLGYGHDERQLRMLSSQMATELGIPGLKAVLPRLVIAINRKRLPPKTDVDVLVMGLQHRNPPVRRLSHGLLVHLFGALEAYDSESSAASRSQQARKWLAAVNRLYRRMDNARKR